MKSMKIREMPFHGGVVQYHRHVSTQIGYSVSLVSAEGVLLWRSRGRCKSIREFIAKADRLLDGIDLSREAEVLAFDKDLQSAMTSLTLL